MNSLPERYREILQLLISDYITSAEPVGSRSLAKRHSGNLSPATIRNVMADLTEMGLLEQPHTSAGRIPTEAAFQYYVESLLHIHDLSDVEKESIRQQCFQKGGIEQFLHRTSGALSSMSRYIGLVVMPGWQEIELKQVEFLRLSRGRLLGIFVAQNGLVQNQLIEVDEDFTFLDLEKINNFCNRTFSGLNLSEARQKISQELESERADYDHLLRQAFLFSEKLFASVPAKEVVIEGEEHLVEHPEFSELEELKKLMAKLEAKQRILKLLDRCHEGEGVKIFVGSRAQEEGVPLSVISASYRKGGHVVGTLGVIGPTRMDYSRIVSVVDFTSKLVSDYLNGDVRS